MSEAWLLHRPGQRHVYVCKKWFQKVRRATRCDQPKSALRARGAPLPGGVSGACVGASMRACMHRDGLLIVGLARALGAALRARARGAASGRTTLPGGAPAACACAPPGACRGRSALGDGRRCRDGMADCIWAQGGEGRGAAGRRHSCTRRTLVIEYLWRTWQAGQCGHGAVAADPFDAVLTPGVTPRPRRAMDRS